MPTTISTCPLDCADACGVVVETDESGRLERVRGNPDHGWSRGVLCGKTAVYAELVNSPDRLLAPLVRDGAALVPTTWDGALDRIAERVGPILAGGRGERILAASYAGSMGLVARKFPMRAMHAMGATTTNSGICDNASTAGFETVLGRQVGPDLQLAEEADLFVLWGCDMRRTLQHLAPRIKRMCGRGVPVVAVDVYRSDTIRSVEAWGGRGLVVAPGSDAALALALTRLAFERGAVDGEFLERDCVGAEEFERHARSGHDVPWAAEATGLDAAAIGELFELFAAARDPWIKTGVGFTRRRHGAMSMRAVCSLAAVLGAGHRVHYESSDAFGLDLDVLERPDLRPAPGREVHHARLGRELEGGRFEAVFVWGHNPAVTVPDERRVRAGLAREDVFVVVHDHFLTETAALADVVLPATAFVEHADVYKSYGHRYLQLARPAARAPEGPRTNVATFAAIAARLGLPEPCRAKDPAALAEELLEANAARFAPGQLERLRAGEPVQLEPPVGDWGTPSGKVELVSERARAAGQPAMATYLPDTPRDGAGDLWLVCAPSVHTHNSTFSHVARHASRVGAPAVHVHPDDAAARGVADGDAATLSNAHGRITLTARLTTDVPRGLVRVDGLPRASDVPERVGINALVSPELSDLGGNSTLFSARAFLAPAAASAAGAEPGRDAP